LKGSITYSGIAEVTERGFLFGSSADNLDQSLQSTDLTNEFTYAVSGLVAGETYYFKAFATNSSGTSYGKVKSFTAINPDSYNIIYSCDFEDDAENQNWTLDRPDEDDPSYWLIGNELSNSGEKSMYVVWEYESEIHYGNANSVSVYGYREIEMPLSGDYWFKFNWMAEGESELDYIRAFIIPVSLNPYLISGYYSGGDGLDDNYIGNTAVPDGWIDISEDIEMSGAVTWRTSCKKTVDVEAGAYYLVFYWTADGTSGGSPGVVDNIIVKTAVLPFVETTVVTNTGSGAVTLNGTLLDGGATEVTQRGFMFGDNVDNLNENLSSSSTGENFTYELTGLVPGKLYYYKAYATNSKGTDYGDVKAFLAPSGAVDGYGYVDLGLPSGTKWATVNLGADSPEKLGGYYEWGGTNEARDDFYSGYSYSDNPDTLPANADAASVNWSDKWSMPTSAEMQELVENCTWTWTKMNGVTGYLVSANSKSIFLPAAGQGLDWGYYYEGIDIYTKGFYWTSSISADNTSTAAALYFQESEHNMGNGSRSSGFSIRAIYKSAPTVSTNFVSNMTISTATLNGSILSGGSSDVTECGFMFGTDSTNLDQNFIIPDISDEFSYQLTDLMAKKTYYYKAYAINSEGTSYGELRSFKVPSGVHNGHEYVDLGLPSCTMWAISNVGASSTEDYGNYYAWGETEVKDNYSSSTNRYHDDELGYIKYNSSDGLTTLESDDDAASVNWGGSWRMPTLSELEELYRYCSHEVVDQNGVHGLRISGNGNSIFLPSAGYYAWGPFNDGNISYYWSSTITDNTDYAVALNSNYENFVFSDLREYGLSVRAVYSACKYVTGITVSDITTESATISWREQGDAENWEMIISEEEIGEAELDLFDNILTLADTSYSAEGLNPGILYHVYVRAACSSDNKSAWKSQTFNTRYLPQIPSTVPYTCDFEDDEENSKWTLSYGGQVNSWYIGTAANNGGSNGMYISNDNGESNQYTNNSSSYAYAFRTIEIPYTADYSISYDWRFVGDGGFSDYLYVFLAHDSLNYNFISGVSQQYFSNCIYVVDYDYSEEAIWNDYSTEKHIEAGTYHLVFNWANDDDGYGDNPPAGIDNISIRMICPEITNLTVTDITSGSATLVWTKEDLAGSYEVIVSETELDEDGLANYGSIVTVTDSVYQATGLAQLTTYYVYVRLVCTTSNKSSWISTSFRTLPVPTVVPYNCDFEDVDENDNWVLNNGNQTNKWYIGTAANNGGDNGLYISDDDGETNEYNINGTSYVYAFRDIQVDEAASYQVSYDWRSYGLSHWDAVWAVLIPKSANANLSAGESNGMVDYYSELPEEWIDVYEEGGAMFSQTEWQTSNKYVNLEDGTYSLVFFWRNSGRGSQPPAAIDNISIVKACLPVENIKTTDITYESATINWDRNFSVTDYKLKISSIAIEEGNLETTTADVFDGIVSDTVKVVSGLIPSTAYYVYVRSVCGPNEYSQWDSTFFKSYQIPVSVPYSCDFENAEENANWSFANEGQNNQWYIGTAANNGGDNGLYISNDNGVSNTYSNTAATFSYAYRDIVVSETGFYHIDFDWRAEGLNFYDMYKLDLLSAFLVPNSLSPIIMGGDANGIFDLYNGTMNATPEGWINLSENGDPLLGQSEWQSNNKELTIEAGTYKLLFYWQNIDKNEIGMEEGGSNPPAAIDNISIWKIACPPVTKIRINDITSNSATISWTERSSATNWKVIISEEAIEDSELNESNAAITVENNPLYVTTGLNPTTKYYVYISAVCSINEVSTWESKTFTTPNLSSTILYYCDFEDEDENENWDLSLTYDSPYSDGEISWEISTQYDNNYEHNLNSPVNYNLRYGDHKCLAYRNITLDSDDYYYKIDFDWRTNSTEPYCAALGVLIPDTSAISEEIYLPSSSITLNECNMFGDNGWQHNTYKSKIAAGDYKLAFIGGVSSVSAVHDAFFEIDNIVIYKSQFSEPILELASATAESASSVTLHGNITDNGGADIIERGFVYGISIENLNMMVQSSDETDEFSATISGFEPGHTYYYRAYAVNNEGTGYGKVNTFIIPSGYHNDHAYVDLGLPSGLLWATMDVGASAFDELGDAYAWGETVTKDEYTDENYTYTDNPETLPSEVDVAAINWSNGWHTPTKDDLQELYDYTTKTIIKRVEGSDYLFCLTGPNGNSIFLRAATGDGYQSIIMSSTLKTDEQDNAYSMVLISVDGISLYGAAVIQRSRSQGYVVRPVRSPELATSSPADEIYNCDFEDDAEYANWTVNNDDQTNHWATGIMSMTSGDKTLFVTNGNDNEYNTGTTSYAYATREIEIEQAGKYQFDFDWRCNGESSYDLLKAFFIPNTATSNFIDGESNGMSNSSNEAPEGWIDISENGTMSSVEDWQHSSKLVSIDAVGLYNLVFFWKNNNSGGSNPPAAVDNIVISRMPPVEVVTQNATRTSTTATVGGELSIEGDVEITQVGFEYGTHDNVLTDTVRMAYAENTFSSQLTDLTPQTNYYYRAFAKYGDDKIAYGDLVKFRTKQNDTDGTEDNPLTIDSAEEWIQFAEAVGTAGGDTINTYKDFEIFDNGDDVYFKLTTDLDFAECGYQGPNMFKGHFNGGGKTITYSNIEQGTAPSAFVYISNATIDSLNILIAESFEIETGASIYGAVGLSASSSSISNCTVSVANAEVVLQSSIYAGGIIGAAQDCNITNCTNNLSINVTSSWSFAGGIAVGISGGSVNSCTNNASVAARYGVGGIVGLISGNGANISRYLNTGNINGLISTGGILGVGMEEIEGAVTIDKCMNTGKLSATVAYENYFGGIAGLWQDNSSISISNCANYGSFSELLLATGGIFGVGSVTLSKNIAAPIYESASVSADNNGYNVYSTIAVPDGAQERYPFTETDDFFDEQVGDIRVDSLRLKFAERGTAKETSQIIGTALQSTLSTNWTYADGLYPMPAGIPESTKATLARVPLYLATGETAFGVRSNFTVPTSISGQPVTWTSDNAAISITAGVATVTRPAEGENDIDVNITAEYDGCTKTFVVRVIAPKHIPVNTGSAVQDTVVTLNGSFDMETVGVTYAKEYGFVYSANSNLADSTKVVSTNLSGLGPYDERNFSASLNGLEEGTRYYYAAFATTGDGTMLGEIKTFRTEGAPDVTMYYPTWRDTISVGLKAKVDMLGNLETYKFYIGLERNSLSEIIDGAIYSDEDSTFVVTASGLTPETLYYAVAEAADEYGTTQSDTLSFYTYGHFKDDRDNATYYTIQIGDQTWMAQNLKYAGDEVSLGTTTSETEPYYYYVNGDEANTDEYGYLYNWKAAMNGASSSSANPSGVQGICPNGWHLPSDAEWTQLATTLGGTEIAGAMLSGNADSWQVGTLTQSEYFGASGFNALPAGDYRSSYSGYGSYAYIWSATEQSSSIVRGRSIGITSTRLLSNSSPQKSFGYAVRCVKGTTIYAYDTVNYCGEQYTFGTQTLTADGDYEETFTLGIDKDSIVYLHLTMHPAVTATVSGFSNGCYNANNGTIEILASNGTPDYTYAWTDADDNVVTCDANGNLSGLDAGTYTLTVTDAAGCTATVSQTLTAPAELLASIEGENPSCHGGSTTLTAGANNGTPDAYAWGSGESSVSITVSPTVTTTYTVTITDANNCTASASVTISQPELLTASLTAGTIACNGGTTNITNAVEGGTPDYTYSWGSGETSQNLTGVTAGTYNVTVTDANSCEATASVTISQPEVLTASLTTGTIACNGSTTNITNTVEGGTPDYTYSWGGGEATQNLTGVTAGTYNVTVTDANSCAATASVTISQPDLLTTSLSAGEIACNGSTTNITNTVEGGTPDYSYYWTGDTHNQNNEGVSAGNYTVTVQDANGCSATSSIAISQPDVLTASLSPTEINCHGETANITNTVTGGNEPYQFAWSNNATSQSLTGVSGGTYGVTVTDANGCTATASVTINEPAELTSELTAGRAGCNGGTANITNTVTGGTEPITYAWSNGANTQSLTGVVAGEYTVTVTDAKGCSLERNAEITQPEILTVTLNAGTIACNGETTTISTSIAGGTTPYTYAWNNDATTENLANAVAGTYSVTVTDANTCATSTAITITQPDALLVSISGPTSVCENTTTTLTANVQGGTEEYQYLWSNAATANAITTPEIDIERPYSVTVTDQNSCTATAGVTVVIGDTPGISITEVQAICVGGDVMLQANVSNAGTDYTVEWTANPTTGAGLPAQLNTETITVMPEEAGSYTYTASLTATSCSDGQPFNSSANVTLTVNSLPDVAITNNTNTTELTCSIAEISLTATGGTTYQWSNSATTATTSVTTPDTYIVTVTDDNTCTNTASITLTQNIEAPTVSITNTTGTTLLTCTTTEIEVLAEGTGTAYLWSNGASTAANTFTQDGTYTVTATAANGCTSTANIQITPNSEVPTVSITNNTGVTELTCARTSISVTATGTGTSYEWSNGAVTAENTLTAPGTFTVIATAANDCSASAQITITQNIEAPQITASATESAICQGGSTTISATGGESYTWSPETGLPSTVGASLMATPRATTTYTVTGVGSNGCEGTSEVTITVNLPTDSELTAAACELYTWNGTNYTESGDFQQTFVNANGCDSVVTLHLTINNAVTNEFSETACSSFEWNSTTYTESGDYVQTLQTVNGCDSVVTLHLTINMPTESNDTVAVCGSYEWNGTTYTETGNYQVTLPNANANGCDSIANLYLTINQPLTEQVEVTACDSYEWNGETYTASGDYEQTFTAVNGCDSIVTLHLTINNSTTGEFADQMCSGVPYVYEGQTFTEAGTYEVTLVNATGCDSIVTLTLTYSNSCNGTISGIITDISTDEPISNARVTFGNKVTRTNSNGEYSLTVPRGRKSLRVSATGFASYSEMFDIQSDTVRNIALYKPEISTDVDSISVTSYPYLAQYDSITLHNTGNAALIWSSVTEYDSLALLPYDEETQQRRNSRSLWDSIQTFTTQFNAEQAIATDGFFIYTSSWQRPGEFNRYMPDGEYIETFYIENVGMIRNLSYDGNYFYGTEATNIIFKLDLDNQTLVDSITTDISNIRHCSFNRQDGSLLAGDWNSLYSIDTATGVSTQIRNDLMNVYSSAYDNLSPGGPYLWLFSQTSQNNGPSAYIRQFSISNGDYTDKTHYLDDIGLGNASLAGGICASEQIVDGKFVLLADVQNPSGNNIIATYEIGRTNNVVRTGKKSGSIEPNSSESISVCAFATATGEHTANIKYRAAVMGRQSNDINVDVSTITPECAAIQQISIATDTFHTVTLDWQPIDVDENESISYLVYTTSSQYPIDTLDRTSVTYSPSVGDNCFYVRALTTADYTCLSEASDTVCATIKEIPCDISLFVDARSDGEFVSLSWNTSVGIDHFSLYRNSEPIDENITATTFVDTDVVAEIDYCYTVIAHFENSVCNEITGRTCIRIATDVCAEAPVLTAEVLGNSVMLEWTASNGATNYKIFRNNTLIETTSNISYMDNVAVAGNYCYRVESICEYGMYNSSNEVCIFADAITEWTADNLTLYPNPTYGQFFIEGQRIAVVQIFNASGMLVTEIENTEDERITINCENWYPGLYNIRIISTDGETATRNVTIFR